MITLFNAVAEKKQADTSSYLPAHESVSRRFAMARRKIPRDITRKGTELAFSIMIHSIFVTPYINSQSSVTENRLSHLLRRIDCVYNCEDKTAHNPTVISFKHS